VRIDCLDQQNYRGSYSVDAAVKATGRPMRRIFGVVVSVSNSSSQLYFMPYKPLSTRRVVIVVLPLILVVLAWSYWWLGHVEADARHAMESGILANMLGSGLGAQSLVAEFADSDGDLVADSPSDVTQCIAPAQLVFSYIAEGEGTDSEKAEHEHGLIWNELVAALAKRAGCPVEYRQFSQTDDQLAAFSRGEVHVIGLNTGAVDNAVQQYGLVPICTLGQADGSYGYTMKIIVPNSDGVRRAADLRGRKITFTRPNSNSGFKAAFVYLMEVQGLLPERDYSWSFSLDHEKSIRQVVDRQTDAAAVASDVLERMVQRGQIGTNAIRTIYESERFPPATIGIAHNLAPELRESIRQTFFEFDWSGTKLQDEFGPMGAERFVPIKYKDDWANIRRIERSIASARSKL
jgi:phosphonate transport system substrate-binding protein